MQSLERPPAPSKPQVPNDAVSAFREHALNESSSLKKLWMTMGDVARDIDTANKMAKDKFDGDSAIMQTARGALTTGVGVGLEKALSRMWDKVWAGQAPFFERFEMGGDVGKKLNEFAQTPSRFDWKTRLAYLIKEGTQDLSIVGIYNFIAFRTQPIFQKAEAKHVLASLAFNTLELPLAPNLKLEMQKQATVQSEMSDKFLELNEARYSYQSQNNYRGPNRDEGVIAEAKAHRDKLQSEYDELMIPGMEGSKNQKFFRNLINVSNPVTMLGMDMIWNGAKTLVGNFLEVRKVRNQKGGLKGKRVFMPKKDYPRDGGRSWQDQRHQQDRRGNQARSKVYYGKSRWDEKQLEEYELKGS